MIRRSLLINATTILLLTLMAQRVVCQQAVLPLGMNYQVYQSIPDKTLYVGFSDTIQQHSLNSSKITSEIVAHTIEVKFAPHVDGVWKSVLPGFDSWFLKLRSSDAYGLALVFSDIRLMPGESLYIYNQQGMHGPYTHRHVPPSGILPVDFLKGDEVMIEFDVPAGRKRQGSFMIETVAHAFQPVFNANDQIQHNRSARYSDDCYLCLEDEALTPERRSVVKLIVQNETGTRICSGVLINNTAVDNTPYLLTAEHCVSNQADADRALFILGDEDERCVERTNPSATLIGAYYRASLSDHDFTLLELYEKPPLESQPYYSGWDISGQPVSGVTCIHHPQGASKKVSVSNGSIKTGDLEDGSLRAPDAFWNVVRWDIGATESGSSGAPLFNHTGRVIGTLSGGSSSCELPYNDYFQKLSASWSASTHSNEQLGYWLDPSNTGVKTLDGLDPFKNVHVECDLISNIQVGEEQVLIPYTNGDGYFSGYNTDGIASYAEKFSLSDSARVTDVALHVGNVNKEAAGGLIVSMHGNEDGLPGAAFANTFIPYSELRKDSVYHARFYPYVKVGSEFFVAYTLSYSPLDVFALKQSPWRGHSTNTAFAKLMSDWVPITNIAPDGAGASFSIEVTVCETISTEPSPEPLPVSFYPNPVTTALIAKIPAQLQDDLRLLVIDLQGRQQQVMYRVFQNSAVVTTADLSPGMYIIQFSSAHGRYHARFVKQ